VHCIITRRVTRLIGIDNDASARPANITSTSCDLDLWPPDPKVDHFMLCPRIFKISCSKVC